MRSKKLVATSIRKENEPSRLLKVRDGRIVEANWSCTLEKSLPADLKPRLRGPNGIPIGHDHPDKTRVPATEWSKAFTHEVAGVSKITRNHPAFAHKQLSEQVRTRQRKREHPQHYARELLKSNIQATIVEIKRLISVGRHGHSTPKRTGDLARGLALIGKDDDSEVAMEKVVRDALDNPSKLSSSKPTSVEVGDHGGAGGGRMLG